MISDQTGGLEEIIRTHFQSSDHVFPPSAAHCGEKSGELHFQRQRLPQVGPENYTANHPSIHPSNRSHCFLTGVYLLQFRHHLWDLLLLQPTGAIGGRSDRTEDFHVPEWPSLQVRVAVAIRSRMLPWPLMPLVLCVQRVRGGLHRPVNVGLLLHLGADRRGCSP